MPMHHLGTGEAPTSKGRDKALDGKAGQSRWLPRSVPILWRHVRVRRELPGHHQRQPRCTNSNCSSGKSLRIRIWLYTYTHPDTPPAACRPHVLCVSRVPYIPTRRTFQSPNPSTGDTLSPEHARRFSHHNRSRSTSAIPTDRSGDIPQSYTNRPSTSRGYRQQSDEFAPGSTQETSLNMTQNTTGIPEVLVSPAVESDFPFDIQRYLNINGESESWRSDTSSPSGASSVYSTPLSGTSDPAVSLPG
ncbi:hypothetical protein BS47DRAFT_1131921 [Hydnum rufescens UP504]|uniref:Uncharacterized protein n=1 Tax=Hydnum rufescens UP504 TaxID=1448309 RepID=A0A9P6ATR8_9AGAM|nr:hypothetical protein BS47DRAFT_1131921 [Hydnum rufescens UP504]